MKTQTASADDGSSAYIVPPVVRAAKLIQYISQGNRCRNTSRASKALGINRTTLIRLLATLCRERYIEPIGDEGGYRLGTELIVLGNAALRDRSVVSVARPILAGLAADTGLSAHLGVREGREIIYLVRETPRSHLVSNVREGSRLAAHATSIGRTLLAELDKSDLTALYDGVDLEPYTSKTRTTFASLIQQLGKDKADGVAWSCENFEAGIGSAATIIRDHSGEAVAGINVTGPASLFAPESAQAEDIRDKLKKAASDISRALGSVGR